MELLTGSIAHDGLIPRRRKINIDSQARSGKRQGGFLLSRDDPLS